MSRFEEKLGLRMWSSSPRQRFTRRSSVAAATKKIFCSAIKRMCGSESAANFRTIVMLSRENQVDMLSAGVGVQTTNTVLGIAAAGKAPLQ
jgi:hypothetical protein